MGGADVRRVRAGVALMGAHSKDRDDLPRTAKVVHVFTHGPKPDNRTVCEQSADGVINWETTDKTYPTRRKNETRD